MRQLKEEKDVFFDQIYTPPRPTPWLDDEVEDVGSSQIVFEVGGDRERMLESGRKIIATVRGR